MSKATKKDVGAIVHNDGVQFRVWAPFAVAVAVTGAFNEWQHSSLESEGDGYWAGKVETAEPGQEYKFVISTGQSDLLRNDPRALQVTTTAGNSVIVEQEFPWTDHEFVAPSFNTLVTYEVHIGTFNRPDAATIGTFDSAIEKLDYLEDLGVNAIEIMPIGSMSNDRGWGYAPDYMYAVESLYGGRRGFLEFVNAAHARGIAVVLDVVYNHFGPDGGLDLWQFDGWSENGKGGIYFYNDWRSKTPWGDTRPDYGRPEVRQYILDNARMWLQECHVDGLRVDSTIYIRNANGNNDSPDDDLADGWHLMQQMNNLARKINPGALMIGEDLGCNEYITKQVADGGAGFSAQWEVGFPHAVRQAVASVYDEDRSMPALEDAITHRYNNDAFQRVVYSDSHDTAGNGGKRLNEEIVPENETSVFARKRSLLASALVLTVPGMPMLLQGQEFMQGGDFNDWQSLDWQKTETFKGIVEAHRHLIALRKNTYGNTKGLISQWCEMLLVDDERKLLDYRRFDAGGPGDDTVIVMNFSNNVQSVEGLRLPRDGQWHVRVNTDWKGYSPDFKGYQTTDLVAENGTGTITLGPYAAVVLSQDD